MENHTLSSDRLFSNLIQFLCFLLLLNICIDASPIIETNCPSERFSESSPLITEQDPDHHQDSSSSIASIFQCLAYLPPFVEIAKFKQPGRDFCKQPNCLFCIGSCEFADSREDGKISSSAIIEFIEKKRQETWMKLWSADEGVIPLQSLEQDLDDLWFYLNHSCQEKIVDKLYQGKIIYTAQCQVCLFFKTLSSENFNEIALEIPTLHESLAKSLETYLATKNNSKCLDDYLKQCEMIDKVIKENSTSSLALKCLKKATQKNRHWPDHFCWYIWNLTENKRKFKFCPRWPWECEQGWEKNWIFNIICF